MIFQKFFRAPGRRAHRRGERPPQPAHKLRQRQQRGQHQAAQREEIRPAPQGQRGHVVDAHPPVVQGQGEQEQRRRRPQPEQQVQDEGQAGQGQGAPQGAHPVVDQPQQCPQQQPLPEDGGLAGNVHVHGQRSRREKKPPRPPVSSS